MPRSLCCVDEQRARAVVTFPRSRGRAAASAWHKPAMPVFLLRSPQPREDNVLFLGNCWDPCAFGLSQEAGRALACRSWEGHTSGSNLNLGKGLCL